MDFVQLPSELFTEIAKYFSIKDLLSCSLVSSYWRSAINKNLLWKGHCQNHCSNWEDVIKYLEVEKPMVGLFDISLNIHETLEPLCEWRVHYMRKVRLLNNWKKGEFKKDYIPVNNDYGINMENEKDLLALNLNIKKKFEIWSIKDPPTFLGEAPYGLQHIMCLECFKLINRHLIFVQCNLLQVFSVNSSSNEIKLKFRRLFNEKESSSEIIPNSEFITEWYLENIGFYPSDSSYRCDVVSNFFIGMIFEQDLENTTFHIWDILSGKKIKEERIPLVDSFIVDINFGTNTEHIFLMLTCTSPLYVSSFSLIYGYNVKNTCYTSFIITLAFNVPAILFTDIFTVYTNRIGDTISVWHSESGVFKGNIIEYDSMIKHRSVQIDGSLLVYATQFLLEQIKVINLKTLQVLSCFQPNNIFNGLYEVLFVRPKFVFIAKTNETAYDIENTKEPLFTLKCKTICPNEIGTKLFVEETIANHSFLCILNFW